MAKVRQKKVENRVTIIRDANVVLDGRTVQLSKLSDAQLRKWTETAPMATVLHYCEIKVVEVQEEKEND